MQNNNGDRPLPVLDIFQEAFKLPLIHFPALLRVGSPFLVVVVLWFLGTQFNVLGDLEGEDGYPFLLAMLFAIAAVGGVVMSIVGCHRVFLMSQDEVNNTKPFRWSGREWRFVGWWVVMGICVFLVMLPISMIVMPFVISTLDLQSESHYLLVIVMVLINLPAYYLISRWSLMLPATAVDQRPDMTWAWELSSGNGLRLTVLIGLFPILVDVIFEFLPAMDSVIYALLIVPIWLIVATIEIGILSLSYRWLVADIDTV